MNKHKSVNTTRIARFEIAAFVLTFGVILLFFAVDILLGFILMNPRLGHESGWGSFEGFKVVIPTLIACGISLRLHFIGGILIMAVSGMILYIAGSNLNHPNDFSFYLTLTVIFVLVILGGVLYILIGLLKQKSFNKSTIPDFPKENTKSLYAKRIEWIARILIFLVAAFFTTVFLIKFVADLTNIGTKAFEFLEVNIWGLFPLALGMIAFKWPFKGGLLLALFSIYMLSFSSVALYSYWNRYLLFRDQFALSAMIIPAVLMLIASILFLLVGVKRGSWVEIKYYFKMLYSKSYSYHSIR